MGRLGRRLFSTALFAAVVAAPLSPARAWAPIDPCSPVWSESPSRYYVNSSGYSQIDLGTIRSIFVSAMAEWGRPCCSSWRASDIGTTSGVGEDGRDGRNIFSFREDSWPDELGEPTSTLAVTLTRWAIAPRDGACVDLTADMIFNAVYHVFGTSHSFSVVDLRAVATHESGHWLGLGHSRVNGSTMWPSYTDESGRTLHSDDQTAVCTLYPGVCNCSRDSDCDEGDVCVGGTCERAPCSGDRDCASGLVCNTATGNCEVPPCGSDAECPGTQVCIAGDCVVDADCPTCLPCTSITDCGGGEWQCAGDGTGSGFCTRICSSSADCPGNSDCFGIEGQSFSICLNDDADRVGICPGSYVCTDTTAPDPCDTVTCGPGEVCEGGTCFPEGGSDGCVVCDACDADADCPGGGCYTFDGTNFVCATDCRSGSDCPSGTACIEFTDGTSSLSLCINDDFNSRGACPSDFECTPPDLCAGRSCPAGQSCDPSTGACVDDDADTGGFDAGTDAGGDDTGGVTDAGHTGGDCAVCAGCTSDAQCDAGSCVAVGAAGNICTIDCAADASICPGNTACFPVSVGGVVSNLCLNADAASAGICPAAFECLDIGVSPTDDVGGDTNPPVFDGLGFDDEGCACTSAPRGGNLVVLILLALGVVVRRRRA